MDDSHIENAALDRLKRLALVQPANEAEVETKILLHLFELLGFEDKDRADKPSIAMNYGRERRVKIPDFILYDGPDRSLSNALIAIEAKFVDTPVDEARDQARSYATWAGTPFYIVCNGSELLAVQFIPGSEEYNPVRIALSDLVTGWKKLWDLVGRGNAILAKERLSYMATYLPHVEQLPASEFLREYLERLHDRFSALEAIRAPMVAPGGQNEVVSTIPVNVKIQGQEQPQTDAATAASLSSHSTRLLITGPAGSGKSTFCKRVMRRLSFDALAPNADVVPIFISLARNFPKSTEEALALGCAEMGIRVFPHLFKKKLSESRVVLVLDGLDELPERSLSAGRLMSWLRNDSASVLLTSRPDSILESVQSEFVPPFQTAVIKELDDEQILSVLSGFLPSDSVAAVLKMTGALESALRTPMVLLMVARIAQLDSFALEKGLWRLYERYVIGLYEYFGAATVRGGGDSTAPTAMLYALERIALVVQSHGKAEDFDLDHLENYSLDPDFGPAVQMLFNIGILTYSTRRIQFVHRSFQEFGIARYLIRCIDRNDPDGFAEPHSSPLLWEFVASEFTPERELTLCDWLSSEGVKVQSRVLKTFSYSFSDRVRVCLNRYMETHPPPKLARLASDALHKQR